MHCSSKRQKVLDIFCQSSNTLQTACCFQVCKPPLERYLCKVNSAPPKPFNDDDDAAAGDDNDDNDDNEDDAADYEDNDDDDDDAADDDDDDDNQLCCEL